MVARDELPDDYDESDEDAHYVKAGEIHIAKPFLGEADANMDMGALTGDHDYLASALLDGTEYDEAFYEWFEAELGLMVNGDPIPSRHYGLPRASDSTSSGRCGIRWWMKGPTFRSPMSSAPSCGDGCSTTERIPTR